MKPALPIKSRFSTIPFFLFLLPVFFVFHGFVEHYGFIRPWYCLKLLGLYLVETAALYLLLYVIYRDAIRPAFVATYLMAFNFSFGYVQDLLTAALPMLSRYRVILGVAVLAGILLVISLGRRPKKFSRPIFFLNTLLLAWLLTDGILLFIGMGRPLTDGLFIAPSPGAGSALLSSPPGDIRSTDKDHPGPDIYFIIFDEYASTASLKKCYGYDNSGLDSFLLQKGFHIQYNSHSNYHETPLCMASIFNMAYLGWRAPGYICSEHAYASCEGPIRHNLVMKFLAARGYSIVNCSQFDLDGHPAVVTQRTLPLRGRLIEEATFMYRLANELGWHHYERWPFLHRFLHHIPYETLDNDQVLLEKTMATVRVPHRAPAFVYAHLEIPHLHFVYSAEGRLRTPAELSPTDPAGKAAGYTGYLPYTNDKLKTLISDIQQNTKNQAVIILMGDHGFRNEVPDKGYLNFFQNLNAVYFPDNDYHLLYDSISGVNQFRVVLNKFFDQKMPMLKDSMVPTADKK
jgi:hypothetical protein